MTRKQLVIFYATLFALFAGRLLIGGRGLLNDPDEFYFFTIQKYFHSIYKISTWAKIVDSMHVAPSEIAVRVIEYITLIPFSRALHKPITHPDVLNVLSFYNAIISVCILVVFYRICLKVKFNHSLSTLGMVLLGTLLNFNIYIRHVLPYDHALLLQLIALNLLLTENVSSRTILVAGIFSAVGLSNYFGYFMLVFINGGVVLTYITSFKKATKHILLFSLPFVIVLLIYDGLLHLVGRSFYIYLSEYSSTVYSEASPDEGIIFEWLYFCIVEHVWGIALLVLAYAGGIWVFSKKGTIQLRWLIILSSVAYLLFGSYVFFTGKMVFHGRILHLYYPFIILGVLYFFQTQRFIKVNQIVIATAIIAFINYGFVIADLNNIAYPRDIIYRQNLFQKNIDTGIKFTYYEEIRNGLFYKNRSSYLIDSLGYTTLSNGNYDLVNVAFLQHFPDTFLQLYRPYTFHQKDSLIFEKMHFQSHPAYTFEYCDRVGRNFYINKQLKIRLVKTTKYFNNDST